MHSSVCAFTAMWSTGDMMPLYSLQSPKDVFCCMPTIFQGDFIFLWTFSCLALSNEWLNFEEHFAHLHAAHLLFITAKKEAFDTHTGFILQPKVLVLVWLFLELLARSFVLNQTAKHRSHSSAFHFASGGATQPPECSNTISIIMALSSSTPCGEQFGVLQQGSSQPHQWEPQVRDGDTGFDT